MNVNEIPLVSFFERVVDPLVIMGMLYLCTLVLGAGFNGYYLVLMVLAFFVSSSLYKYVDPYRTWRTGQLRKVARDIVLGWLLSMTVLALIGVSSGMLVHYDRNVLLAWCIGTPLVLILGHLAVLKLGAAPVEGQKTSVVIIGANDVSVRFAATINRHESQVMAVHGYFDDRADERRPSNMTYPMLGRMSDIPSYVRQHNIKMIVISQPISAQPRIMNLLEELEDTTASVYFLPDIYIFDLMQARFASLGGMPVIGIRESPFTGFNSMIKRISDIVLALIIQIMLTPIMLTIALAVKLTSPGPVIFRQRRYGLYGEEILVYKFRSMTVAEDGAKVVQATKGDQRLTKIGGFLRRTSLDELPQFINVLQGRMSIVGPRPHAVAHNEQYRKLIKGYMLRHKAKPGITGWAQVNGLRGETDTLDKMQARIQYDLDYLRNWSVWLDMWIIVRTVLVVLKRENAH